MAGARQSRRAWRQIWRYWGLILVVGYGRQPRPSPGRAAVRRYDHARRDLVLVRRSNVVRRRQPETR
jgi:hypothetical protein